MKLQGQNCWGKPWTQPEINTDYMSRMNQEEICSKVLKFDTLPYPDWLRFQKNCTQAVCDSSNLDWFNQERCDKIKCDKVCLNTHNMDPKCMFCRYGVTDINDCKGDCKRIKGGIQCHTACDTYKKLRLNGVDQNDPTYMEARDRCKSDQCSRGNQVMCKTCMNNCEKYGKRIYNSMLGTNIWRQNFAGWGCNYPCNAAHISKLSEFRGVDLHDPAVAKFTKAFDAMSMGAIDWDHMDALKEWAKEGWRSEQ